MTKDNKTDIRMLIDLVKSMTLAEFEQYIVKNCLSNRHLGNDIIDFEFRSLTATIYKGDGHPYLAKTFDCWDEFGSLETSVMIASKTYFKQ